MIPVERQWSAERINAVLNHPAVRPWVAGGDEQIDIAPLVADQRNVLLMGEHGGCMFRKIMPGTYEVHTQVMPEARGQWTSLLTEACAHYMFTRTDCYEVLTRVPEGHVAARTAALNIGMKFEFTRHNECEFRGRKRDVHIFSIRIQDWIVGADHLTPIGRQFHDVLHTEAERLGVADPAHDDDDNHNKYVGATIEMARAGHVAKAIHFYNRWAVISRHEPIALVGDNPPVVKIDHGLFVAMMPDGSFKVMLP